MPKRSRISTFWGPETQFLRAFSSAPIHQLPKPPKQISSCSLGNSLMRAEAPLPHPRGGTSLFPAKREVKREVPKAWQAWPRNQTSSRCLVISLVCLGGCSSHPHGPRRCPMEPWIGAVGVRSASVGTRWRPQGCPAQGHPPKNRSEKKSPGDSSAPSQRKVIPNAAFRACRGL